MWRTERCSSHGLPRLHLSQLPGSPSAPSCQRVFAFLSLQWLQLWLLFCPEAWGGWGSWDEARKEYVAGSEVEGPEKLRVGTLVTGGMS